jgi:hypothetical protein
MPTAHGPTAARRRERVALFPRASEGLTIVTADRRFAAYDVSVIDAAT